jgi:hypothetical protein
LGLIKKCRSCWDRGENPRKSGSMRSVRSAGSEDAFSITLVEATLFCAGSPESRRVLWAENGVSMPPLRYRWQEDATGEGITSGLLRKALADTEELPFRLFQVGR